MPFLAGIAICVLAGIGLIDATFKKNKEGKGDPLFKGVKWRRILLTLTALLGYLLALKPLGFLSLHRSFCCLFFADHRPPSVGGGGGRCLAHRHWVLCNF